MSRLTEYELWNRIHVRDLARTHAHADAARLLLARLAWLELHTEVLERARHPFPVPVGTLDALHLASLTFLRERGRRVALATYDARMAETATAMGVPLWEEPAA